MRIGQTLGSYQIVDLVGQGGMAAVYVGEHRVVRHKVAIKVVHPRHLDNLRMAHRFLNEARAVATIRHPGIVEFYDLGRADDGRAYIVMELLSGETVASRLASGPIPAPQVVAFGRQMASALAAAHDAGIVHRDLKPANVFLVADPDVPGGERTKILDFGIAKRTDGSGLDEVTGTGVLIGTPAHMSPEQCRGDRILDGRSDVYALGVLLYNMVVGKLPFDHGTTNEIVSRQLYERCTPASEADPRVPPALSKVIARCMAKDPQERYPSMAELGEALRTVERELDARPATPAPRRRAPQLTPMTPTAPYGVKLPLAGASDTSPTLTRTIVDPPSRLGALVGERARWVVLAAAAVTMLAIGAVIASPSMHGGDRASMPATAADVASSAAAEPDPAAPEPVPEVEIVEAAERPAAARRDEPARRAEPARPPAAAPAPRDRATPERPAHPERPPRAGRDDDDAPRKAATRPPVKPKAKPSPAAPPAPKEDPFAAVTTPAVY